MTYRKKVTEDELYTECKEVWNAECLAGVSNMVEYILHQSQFPGDDYEPPFSWDNVVNMDFYSIPDTYHKPGSVFEESYTKEGKDDLLEELQEEFDALDALDWEELTDEQTARHERLEDGIYEISHMEPERWNVVSWWMVSGWLAGQLAKRGEPVLSNYIWGRVGSGQSAWMDNVIREIVIESRKLEVIS